MNAPKEGEELRTVFGQLLVWELDLATEVVAANAKAAKRAGENREAIGSGKEVVRTKCESPRVAVGKPHMANLVGVPDCLYGSHRVSCVHEFSGCELLSWKTLRKLPPNGIFSNRLLPAEMEDEPNNSNGYETEGNERRFHNRGGRSTTQAQRAGPRDAWIATGARWPVRCSAFRRIRFGVHF